jgi:hypothetical protein
VEAEATSTSGWIEIRIHNENLVWFTLIYSKCEMNDTAVQIFFHRFNLFRYFSSFSIYHSHNLAFQLFSKFDGSKVIINELKKYYV